MLEALARFTVNDGDRVPADDIPAAVTAAPLRYGDGSEQWFLASGLTTFFEGGHPSEGQWSVDTQGRFTSFWPPSYRATYDLFWLVRAGRVAGLRFVDVKTGGRFDGSFRCDG